MQDYISDLMNGVLSHNKKELKQLRNCDRTMDLPKIIRNAVYFRIQDLEAENELIHDLFSHYI